MIKAILLTITFALFVSAEFRTNFGVTYPKNSNLPSSEKDAISAKWIKIGTFASCGSKYISPNKDITNMLIFDQQGGIAGIEVGKHSKPEEPMLSRYYEEGTFEGKTYYSLTGYFVDPKAICGQRTAGKYGDRVWWKSNDSSFIKLPLSQAEAEKDPNWVIGTCILGMGIHYWYQISKHMECKDFAPFFVMYNSGHLTTFAVGFPDKIHINSPDTRYEHAPKWAIKANFKEETFPVCLMDENVKVNTMHLFHTSVFSNRCQKASLKVDKLKCIQDCLKKKLGPKRWEEIFNKCKTDIKCYLKEAGFAGISCGIECLSK